VLVETDLGASVDSDTRSLVIKPTHVLDTAIDLEIQATKVRVFIDRGGELRTPGPTGLIHVAVGNTPEAFPVSPVPIVIALEAPVAVSMAANLAITTPDPTPFAMQLMAIGELVDQFQHAANVPKTIPYILLEAAIAILVVAHTLVSSPNPTHTAKHGITVAATTTTGLTSPKQLAANSWLRCISNQNPLPLRDFTLLPQLTKAVLAILFVFVLVLPLPELRFSYQFRFRDFVVLFRHDVVLIALGQRFLGNDLGLEWSGWLGRRRLDQLGNRGFGRNLFN